MPLPGANTVTMSCSVTSKRATGVPSANESGSENDAPGALR